jgi:hypothetical protein
MHPALPRPALTPVRPTAVSAHHDPAPSAPAPLTSPLNAVGSGATSDVLRTVPDIPAGRGAKGGKHKPKEPKSAKRAKGGHAGRRKDAAAIAVPRKAESDKTVVVEVPMPKSLRKRLDAQAEALGYSREEAVLLLLRAWIDG